MRKKEANIEYRSPYLLFKFSMFAFEPNRQIYCDSLKQNICEAQHIQRQNKAFVLILNWVSNASNNNNFLSKFAIN